MSASAFILLFRIPVLLLAFSSVTFGRCFAEPGIIQPGKIQMMVLNTWRTNKTVVLMFMHSSWITCNVNEDVQQNIM